MMAGKAGIADHINIGAKAIVGAYAGVHTDIPEGEVFLGTPARPQREFKRWHLTLEKLPELRKQVAEMRRRLGLERGDLGSSSDDARAAG
jgi:UDP-3-O-[3-hydroxymyristoyl] glucosamine N-acyltransferase